MCDGEDNVIDGEGGSAEQAEDDGDDGETNHDDACPACCGDCGVPQRMTDADVAVYCNRHDDERRERNVGRYQELQTQPPHTT